MRKLFDWLCSPQNNSAKSTGTKFKFGITKHLGTANMVLAHAAVIKRISPNGVEEGKPRIY